MNLIDHALRYAQNGHEIFPCKPDKAPYTDNGMKDATTNQKQIRAWWTQWPDALIAARIPPDVVVLDIDPRHGGDQTWHELEQAYAPIPLTRSHRSGRNDDGFHGWFQHPGTKLSARRLHQWARNNNVGHPAGTRGWTSGIDVLHHGHRYSILPPSPHDVTGQPYKWMTEGEPGPMPGFLAHLITAEPPAPAPPSAPRLTDNGSIADWYTDNHTWADILTPLGWTLIEGDGEIDGSKWRHPQASASWSASVRHDCLFVYTPNTDFDETEPGDPRGYTKFKAWATTNHPNMSDAARAARELRDEPTPHKAPPVTLRPTPDTTNITTDDTPNDWPAPIPLGTATHTPPFPLHTLPDWISEYAQAVATNQQVAIDLPAQLAISALSVANAKHYQVDTGAWTEPLNTYTVTALPPSAGKSPVFKRMTGTIDKYELTLIEDQADDAALAHQKRRMIEKALAKAETAGDTQEALHLLDQLAQHPEPIEPCLLADDITVEALVDLLRDHGRLGMLSPEGGLFDTMTGRYSDKANLDPYLQAWDGGTIRIDRIGRGRIVARNPLLTIGLTVQPSIIEKLADKPELRGRGLTARFMYSVPTDFVGRRNLIDITPVPGGLQNRYEARLMSMLTVDVPETPRSITMAPEASLKWSEWRQEHEWRRQPQGDLRDIAEWVTKMHSTVARVAALLHIADGEDDRNLIDVSTVQRAMEIGDYWLDHAKIVADLWGADEATAHAKTIIAWLREANLTTFTIRDLMRGRRSAFPKVEQTVEPLNLLTDNLWITPMFEGPLLVGRRGAASPEFSVTPHIQTGNLKCDMDDNLWTTCGQPEKSRGFSKKLSPMSPMSLKTFSEVSLSLSPGTDRGYGTTDMGDMGDNYHNTPPVDKPVDNSPPTIPAPTPPTDTNTINALWGDPPTKDPT